MTPKSDFRQEMFARHRHISRTLTNLIGDDGIGGQHGKRITLVFSNLYLELAGRQLLKGVSGEARPGQLLSIMGPSGSGKTTLLNCISGRLPATSGQITLNGRKQIKAMKRYVGYVLQDEVFFGELTVLQIMKFTACIRLPEDMDHEEKMDRVDQVIELLGLTKCRNTIVGTPLKRGVSGGERKRLNIAVQLLTWPSLILLDEPTSGLDSSTAYDLILTLRELTKRGCTVITTIHQPSSAVYQLFDRLLVLRDGYPMYYGLSSTVVSHFESKGFQCPEGYNPGDFVLELAKSEIFDKASKEKPIATTGQHSLRRLTITKTDDYRHSRSTSEHSKSAKGQEPHSPYEMGMGRHHAVQETDDEYWKNEFPTTWWTQFKALFHRSFQVKKTQAFDFVSTMQVAAVAVITSLVWFQMADDEKTIEDRVGCIFFILIFWAFFPMFAAVNTFPPERAVLMRERSQGQYRLSAYYVAKVVAEMPLNFLNPTIFLSYVYWMAGLNKQVSTFFMFWLILLVNVEFVTSFGMLISAAVPNPKNAMTCVSIFMLSSMLLGGFYVNSNNLPYWIRWLEWFSFVKYSFGAGMTQIFNSNLELSCSDPSEYDACNNGGTISGTDVLKQRGVRNYPVLYPLVLLGLMIVSKISAYFVLYYKYKPKMMS
mmetsp:Transcript_23759/g.42102  ORF Transcript_23759/g.42102 Transcript_23759/m.42102 type:complete len:653 (+) Transcript_23759:149-2107(+)